MTCVRVYNYAGASKNGLCWWGWSALYVDCLYSHSRVGVDVARVSLRVDRVLHILLRRQIKSRLCWWGQAAFCVGYLYSHNHVGIDVARASLQVDRVLYILLRH